MIEKPIENEPEKLTKVTPDEPQVPLQISNQKEYSGQERRSDSEQLKKVQNLGLKMTTPTPVRNSAYNVSKYIKGKQDDLEYKIKRKDFHTDKKTILNVALYMVTKLSVVQFEKELEEMESEIQSKSL